MAIVEDVKSGIEKKSVLNISASNNDSLVLLPRDVRDQHQHHRRPRRWRDGADLQSPKYALKRV